MPRALSAPALQSVLAQEGGAEVFVVILAIEHDSITPIRVANNMEDVISGGDTYLACAFNISLPAEQDDVPPQVRLRIQNVDRLIVEGVRLLTGPPTITMTVVLASSPDTAEAGPFVFTLRSVEYDALEVSGVLAFEDMLNESYPADSFSPNLFPGLFKAA